MTSAVTQEMTQFPATYLQAGLSTKSGSLPGIERRFFEGAEEMRASIASVCRFPVGTHIADSETAAEQ